MARQALAEKIRTAPPADVAKQPLFKQSSKAASYSSDLQTSSTNTLRPAASGSPSTFRAWALRGFIGVVLATGLGIGAFSWLGSSGDAAKTTPSQPAPLAQAAPTAAALPPELTPLLQSMARDLASLGKEVEQSKAGRELMVRDNANLSAQIKAGQEQLTQSVARLSEQLKASQEQAARVNANAAEQIKAIQDQLTSVTSRASEQYAPPRIAVAPPRPTPAPPRPAAPAARTPGPTVLSPQASAQPKAEKPKLSSTSRPPAPAR